jgi:hypothetical protein
MPLITLAVIDAAALLNELLSKCIAFHSFARVGYRTSLSSRDVILIFNLLSMLRAVRAALVSNRWLHHPRDRMDRHVARICGRFS